MRSRHAYGEVAEYTQALKSGLAKLTTIPVELCPICQGHGEYQQRYIEGRLIGKCDACDGFGVIYRHAAMVPASLYNQILVAGGLNVMPDKVSYQRPRQPERLG